MLENIIRNSSYRLVTRTAIYNISKTYCTGTFFILKRLTLKFQRQMYKIIEIC